MTARNLMIASAMAAITALPAWAVSLAPGDTLSPADYFDFGEVTATDASWYGTLLGTFTETVTETRDGFSGGVIVPDLYSVTASLTVDVYQNSGGTTTFAYTYLAQDNGGAGTNGSLGYEIMGFEGWDIDVGWTSASFPYVPVIERSTNGDTISVGYFDPLDSLSTIETILLRTDAPLFDTNGTGTALISLDTFGTIEGGLSGLAQPAAVPLPPAAAGLAFGLVALFGLRRSRSR